MKTNISLAAKIIICSGEKKRKTYHKIHAESQRMPTSQNYFENKSINLKKEQN